MRKIISVFFTSLLFATTAYAQSSAFVDKNQSYEYKDGKTVIKMYCCGIATIKNSENDFGRHYETVLYVTTTKKENYFQGVIHKDSCRQISAKRTSRDVFAHYVWDENKIIKYDINNDFDPNYSHSRKTLMENDNTVDLCGLIYLLRCNATAETLETETLLVDKDIFPLTNIEIEDNGQVLKYSIKVGDEYHITSRIRKDEARTPEYLDIDIPGFSTKATLVEYRNKIALR